MEAEQALLGSILIDAVALAVVGDMLAPDMLWHERHRTIYRAILHLNDEDKPYDLIATAEQLRAQGDMDAVGGPVYLTGLVDMAAAPSLVEYYAGIIRDKYIRRNMIQAANEIATMAQEEAGDLDEQASQAQAILHQAVSQANAGGFTTIGDAAERFWRSVYGKGPIGVITGFSYLDTATGGFQPGDVVVLAARPGQGKTTLAIQIAHTVAKAGGPVAFFSLEMSAQQIANRLLVGLGKLSNHAIRQRNLTPTEWDAGEGIVKQLAGMPWYVDDQAGLTTTQVRARARRLKTELGSLGLVVVDFLQLLGDKQERGTSRNELVAYMARSMKIMARELQAPVLLLSQLNRNIETRQDKRPTLADLRDSGEIEQVADVVIFIHQPGEKGSPARELLIEKQRMLPPGTVKNMEFVDSWFRQRLGPGATREG